MATSTLTFYENSKLNISKNFIVENLKDYLSTISVTKVISNFQYQRIELEKTIKVDIPQTQVSGLYPQLNYLKIVNSDNTGFNMYYFIKSYKQVAEETIQFELILDTLNTYGSQIQFDKRTKVLREHKDRIKYNKRKYELDVDESIHFGQSVIALFDDEFRFYDVESIEIENDQSIDCTYEHIDFVSVLDNVLRLDISNVEITGANPELIFHLVVNQRSQKKIRNIDIYSENINPQLFGKSEEILLDSKIDENAYLVYKSNVDDVNENSPIDTFLCFDNYKTIDVPSAGDFILNVNDFENGKYYYFCEMLDERISTAFEPNLIIDGETIKTDTGFLNLSVFVVHRNGSFLDVKLVQYGNLAK